MDIISTSLANKAISGLKTKADISGTSVTIPRGTTAERPTLGASENAIRYNTTDSTLEEWNGTEWRSISADASCSNIFTNKTIDDYTNIVKANAVHSRVKNQSGVTMTKGAVVAYSGYSDSEDAIKVVKADNTTGVAIGILNDDILADEFGMMISTGIIDGLDTSAYTNGTILYTDATGGLTDVEPTTGFSQPIAYVLKSNENIGVLQVLAAYPKQDADDVRGIDTIVKSNFISSGVINKQDDSLVFSTTVGNEYKLQDNSRFFNFDGKVIELPSGIEIDMTDSMPEGTVETTTTITSEISLGNYVVIGDDIYRAKQTAPAGTLATNTAYFEDRTQYGITNKILATMKDDGTIKTEVCFVDTDIEHCGNAHIVMTDNGYSKLSNGLYSKDGDVVTPIGTWSTLNKGAFHPVYNYFGTKYPYGGYWHSTVTPTQSSSQAFMGFQSNGSVSSGSSENPQGKFYDIIYPDQWIDLRIEANAISEQDELNRVGTKAKSGQLDGIGGSISYPTIPNKCTCLEVEILDGTAQTVWDLTRKATTVHQVLKSTDGGDTWTSISFTHQSIANTITVESSDKIMISYTVKIPTTQVQDPKPVKLVGNYVTATNSHDILDGNQLVPTGKVNVSDLNNNLESVVVDNIILDENGAIKVVPKHSTINLNSSNSPAVKFIETIAVDEYGMAHYQVFAQEMVTNSSAYDGDDGEFTKLTNGTITDDNANTVKTIVSSIPLNKYIGDE
jgi:hypothetical protein